MTLSCSKEDVQSFSKNILHKSSSNSSDEDMEFTKYIEVPDYNPANEDALHLERNEFKLANDNNTSYRDRTLSESMFLLEATINFDGRIVAFPFNKFKREIIAFDLNKSESGNITGSSLKNSYNTIFAKIQEVWAANRFVGMIDVEAFRVTNNQVRARAVIYTGEIDFTLYPNNRPDGLPYGDMTFINIPYNTAVSFLACDNTDPLDHAANYLSGDLYANTITQQTSYIYRNIPGWNNFVPGSYIIGAVSTIPTPAAYNVHSPHWPMLYDYQEYRRLLGSAGYPTFQDFTATPSIITLPNYPAPSFFGNNCVKHNQLVGGVTTGRFTPDFTVCDQFDTHPIDQNTSSIYGTGLFSTKSPGWTTQHYYSVPGTCIVECQYNDYVVEYMDHLANVRSSLPATQGNILGCQVFEGKSHLEYEVYYKPTGTYDQKGQEIFEKIDIYSGGFFHFLSPMYGGFGYHR